jgi:hypothetical protein
LDNHRTFACNSLNSSKKELSSGKLGMGIALLVAAAASRCAGLTSSANKPTQDVSSPMCKSKSLLAAFTAALLIASAIAIPSHVFARKRLHAEATTAAELAGPTMEQRARISKHINNRSHTRCKSQLMRPVPPQRPQMASTALVLIKTLPGLALFWRACPQKRPSLLAMHRIADW